MKESCSYCRGLRLDRMMRIATDNVMGRIQDGPYIPGPPPCQVDFLLLDGTDFLLLDGTNFLLLEECPENFLLLDGTNFLLLDGTNLLLL